MKTTIQKHGDALVMVLTPEILEALGAREGDRLIVTRTEDGGLRIALADPSVAAALDAAGTVMDENDDLLRDLADRRG